MDAEKAPQSAAPSVVLGAARQPSGLHGRECIAVAVLRQRADVREAEMIATQRVGQDRKLRCCQRLLAVALRQREDFDAGGGDAYRVLELRRQRAVAGDGGPAVGQDLHMI